MRDISITSKSLDYGITVDSIFWVEQGILTRENVRQSRDEELIADLLGYVLLNPKPSSSSDVLDEIFGFSPDGSPSPKREDIENAIKKVGAEQLMKGFTATHEVLRAVINRSGKRFNHLMFKEAGGRVPRYYQSVFLAVHDLVVNDGMVLKDEAKAAGLLDGAGANIEVGDGGGRWSAADREKNANAIKGIIRPAFAKRGAKDPVLSSWVTELENLLMQSSTEQSLYDFKQGFMNLDGSGAFDDAAFKKVFKTLAAMANHGPGATGYIIVGVADSKPTADRLAKLYGIKPTLYNKFRITGIEHEAKGAKGPDGYLQVVIQKLAASGITKSVKDQIKRDVRLMSYFDKSLLILEVKADKVPCAFDGKYYERHGPNVAEVTQDQYPALFGRFFQPQT